MKFKYKQKIPKLFTIAFIFILLGVLNSAQAQYFGQNKVRYKNLKFQVYKTPHFELYYYTQNNDYIKRFAKESEVWYTLHQQIFKDTFNNINPIILYGNSPEFQQTTAIDGEIGVGTGGVTEGLKNRVVLPINEINSQTRHVLGHELVHAFQYHSLITGDSTQLENIGNLPLWMIEGMAEYLSLGKTDANTAMWMRDAVLNKDIPTLNDLTSSGKYFPYRYGQAFWSFIGSTYGDSVILPLFKQSAKYGYPMAIRRTFGYDEKTLSTLWRTALETAYKPLLKDTAQVPIGLKIVDDKNGGKMNVAPAISPNGKYLVYLSERELFSIDLYLADAKTGKIIRKLTSKIKNNHIDEFNFIESAGAWSPDSKQFAFSVFSEGRNKLIIVNISNGKTVKEIAMGDVEQFGNLTWSPNGNDIAFSGLKHGQSDLFAYNLKTKILKQLTDDKFSDYQPNYSQDGLRLVFSTDRVDYDADVSATISMNMAILNLDFGTIKNINVFLKANNLNPVFANNDSQVYFLSNKDGFRNLYRITVNTGYVEQLTNYFTGISGITENAPALSISNNGNVVYSYYRAQKYTLYNAKIADFKATPTDPKSVNFTPAMLPPLKMVGVDIVNKNIDNFLTYDDLPVEFIKPIPYRPQFKLDYLASNGVDAGVSRFGAGLQSGVQAQFSDILSRNQIFAAASVNGQIQDFGAQLAYINQKSRWSYGGSVSHIPFQFGYRAVNPNLVQTGSGELLRENYTDIIRIFQESLQGFSFYPISRSMRVEVGTGVSYYSYRVDRLSQYYLSDQNGNYLSSFPVSVDRRKVNNNEFNSSNPFGYNIQPFASYDVNTFLVGDNAVTGVTSTPLDGFRYRIGLQQAFGTFKYMAPTLDLRKYVRTKPVTFAGRFYSFGRFGDVGNQINPLFIGYPQFIRGYEANSFFNSDANGLSSNGFSIDQLIGNRFAIANFEIRLPFTGPPKLSVIPSKMLFSELNLFFDAGIAWNAGDKISLSNQVEKLGFDNNNQPIYSKTSRIPALSAGISARVNVFGYLVLEPYFAFPFTRNDVKLPIFGLTFAPGW